MNKKLWLTFVAMFASCLLCLIFLFILAIFYEKNTCTSLVILAGMFCLFFFATAIVLVNRFAAVRNADKKQRVLAQDEENKKKVQEPIDRLV